MTSMVGTWTLFVTRRGPPLYGREARAGRFTFNADSNWTNIRGEFQGRWFQVGDQVLWTTAQSNGANVYAGNIQPGPTPLEGLITGIMGWLNDPGNPSKEGTFRALRLLVDPPTEVASGGVPEDNSDLLHGPVAADEG